jgi:hypothetical protein
MTKNQLLAVLVLGASLSACGGNDTKVDCDDGLRYQNRVEGKRVIVPEGLDALDEFGEMPIPKADPNAVQIPPGQCADMPPAVGSG